MARPFSALEIPTFKGGGGMRNGKDRVSVLKTIWQIFFKWLLLESSPKIMKIKYLFCSATFTISRIHLKTKLRAKEG